METETEKTDSAQDAAQEVKVFRFTYEKEKIVTSSIYVPAKTKEEAGKFLENRMEDVEYKLESNVYQDDWTDTEWELLDTELESETVDGQSIDWDYDEDVLPAIQQPD